MPRRPHLPGHPVQRAEKQPLEVAYSNELSGPVRTPKLSQEQRKKIAQKGPVKRWEKGAPTGDNPKIR
jgi:hypothetical protein